MADSTILCAVCSEVLPDAVDTNITDYALTQCCYQPICQCCADFIAAQSETVTEVTTWPGSATNTFTCPNCRTATTVVPFNINQALDSVLTNLQARHYSVMAVIKMHPTIIHFQEQKLAKSEQQLEANLTAVLSQASKLKATSAKVLAAVQAHRQAQYKNFQLFKADYQRLRHQIDAGIKYLTRWQQQISQITKSTQFKPNQDSQTLIKLDYALSRFQHKLEEVPRVPDYIPVRWFNDQLVLDDYEAQFKAVADHKPTQTKTYPGLVRHLRRDLQLGDFIEAVILVEPNLTCYQCGRYGYALVDSTGKVIHYCYDRVLAINSTWLVTLVLGGTDHDPSQTHIQVQLLTEVIKTLTPSPCGPRIRIFPVGYKRETPQVEIVPGNSDLGLSDQLIIWYERFDLERGQTSSIYSPGITTVQKWSIEYLGSGLQCEMTAELLAKQDLPSDQNLSEYHCDNAVFWRDNDRKDPKYYGCVGLYDREWRDLNPSPNSDWKGLRPIEMTTYKLIPDGSLLTEEDDQNGYYRPLDSGEVSVKVGPFSRDVYNQITTTGWDGRIVKVNTAAGEDEADVVMEFY